MGVKIPNAVTVKNLTDPAWWAKTLNSAITTPTVGTVTNDSFASRAANSVIGRASDSAGKPADIQIAEDKFLVNRAGILTGSVIQLSDMPASAGYIHRYGTDESSVQDAIDALPDNGGKILLADADISAINPANLSTGDKAITWVADRASLPLTDLPGVVQKAGKFTLPETSWQTDKDARVHDFREIGETQATSSTRQYGIHIHGYMSDGPADDVRELRAYSFDLGTDESYNQADIRGIKGRVYADGGNANIRSIYGFAEGFNSHTGNITGLIGTVNRGAGGTGQAVAVLGHVGPDDATSNSCAAFMAGANGTGVQVSYGYLMQTGANALLPTQANYLAHGGGTGDLYRGIKSNTDNTVIYSVDKSARVQAQSFYSGRTSIADDGVATLTVSPASGTGGIIIVWIPDVANMYGMAFFRLSGTPFMTSMIEGSLVSFTTGTLAGTTGVDGELTVSARDDGTIQFENRQGATREVQWMLLHNATGQGSLT